MDQPTYQRWWPLHLRVARGESLSAEERTFYEAGLAQLEQGEQFDGALRAAQEAQAAVAALEAEHAALAARRKQVEAEIAALKAALGERGAMSHSHQP